MKLLNEILGTKYPIIQGGMANIATLNDGVFRAQNFVQKFHLIHPL